MTESPALTAQFAGCAKTITLPGDRPDEVYSRTGAILFIKPDWKDVQFIEKRPEFGHCLNRVPVELRLPDPKERPSVSFKISLSLRVSLVALWAVPVISVAFDSQFPNRPLDNNVNLFTVYSKLGVGKVVALHDAIEHSLLKYGIKWVDLDVFRNSRGNDPVRIIRATLKKLQEAPS